MFNVSRALAASKAYANTPSPSKKRRSLTHRDNTPGNNAKNQPTLFDLFVNPKEPRTPLRALAETVEQALPQEVCI